MPHKIKTTPHNPHRDAVHDPDNMWTLSLYAASALMVAIGLFVAAPAIGG